MSVFFRPIGSNNVFYFFEDSDNSGHLKTISYNVDSDGSIAGMWEKSGTLKQLLGAVKSVELGKTEIISEVEWNNLTKKGQFLNQNLTNLLGG
tara:strand:+ start:1642 stop:1920 length:279 start_codon:yes stop_codon:yes gene_type:complete